MDIVHHAVIGVIGLTVAESLGFGMGGVFFLIGSILPDLDVFLMLFGKRVYLKNHQGFSHSFVFLPLFSLLIVVLLIPFVPFAWSNVFAIALGILVHVLLDYSNTYGISLLYPFSKKRFSLDSIFFIDTFLFVLSVSVLLLKYHFALYITLFLFYVTFKILLQRAVHQKLRADFTIPSALNPFDFYIYTNSNAQIITYQYNALTQKKRNYKEQENIDEKYRHLLNKSQIYKDIDQITKALHITDVTVDLDTVTVNAKDLALRNFGGKFATTTLIFNKEEELLDEISNI